MTGQEMIDSFYQYYDRITNFSAPGYETDEVLLFLNNAQDEFIKDRAFGKGFQPPALEDNQKRVADLRPLITNITKSVAPGASDGLHYTTGPSDYLYYITSMAKVTRTNPTINAEFVECKYIKNEEQKKFLHSAVNVTHHINPVVFSDNYFTNNLWIQADSYTTISHIGLSYISQPTAIETGAASVLEDHTHQEIVDIAVRQALQVQQDPRWQSQVAEQKIKDE